MYNSSIKGQNTAIEYDEHLEIPFRVFFNDMSKTPFNDAYAECDVIYSEIAWSYGYPKFNKNAGNESNDWRTYVMNIAALIEKLNVPAFIITGKPARKYFGKAKIQPIKITTSGTNMDGCQLYIFNCNDDISAHTTDELTSYLSQKYNKCLDFSCGYGEHLFKFKDFIASDIDRNCLTYICKRIEGDK